MMMMMIVMHDDVGPECGPLTPCPTETAPPSPRCDDDGAVDTMMIPLCVCKICRCQRSETSIGFCVDQTRSWTKGHMWSSPKSFRRAPHVSSNLARTLALFYTHTHVYASRICDAYSGYTKREFYTFC